MEQLLVGLYNLHWQQIVMYAIGGALIYLAIKKDYEPMLLLPIGFGAILVNLPLQTIWQFEKEHDSAVTALVNSYPDLQAFFVEHLNYTFENGKAMVAEPSILKIFFETGILTEIFPVLIFLAVGAMIDFSPLLKNPKMLLFGAAAQFGIFFTVLVALAFGFDLPTAASIGIIGAADGPTSIFVASKFAKDWLGPISVAAYSYMSLVPIIQPPVIRFLTTPEERRIRMDAHDTPVPKIVLIIFPIAVTMIAGIVAPISVPLVGFLMFGNLLRVAGVVERLSKAAQNELANLVTLLLGITIGATMSYDKFLKGDTLLILAMGLVAFIFDTAGGVLFAKLLNMFSTQKVNPMIGAAGISAFPMSSRVIHKMGQQEDFTNFLLMPAVSANVAGQLGSVVAGAMVLMLVPWLLGW